MDKHEKIIIGILVAVVVGVFFYTRSFNNSAISMPSIAGNLGISTNVPWYLTYNNSPEFSYQPNTQQIIPLALPNNSVGQANGSSDGSCQICSLFPNFATVQL